MHASNLAAGRAFEATGYIYNPSYPSLGPRSYPPGYPVLLAPGYVAFGMNLIPMRLLTLAFFAGSLILLGLLYRSRVTPPYALLGVALVAINPGVQGFAVGIGSDIPFLFFLLLCSLTVGESRNEEESPTRSLLIGILMFAAYSIRTVGGLLVPALVLARLWRPGGRVRGDTLISLAGFTVLAVVQSLWSTGSASYLDQFRPSLAVLASSVWGMGWAFSGLWDTGLDHLPFGELLRKSYTLFAVAMIAVGFISRVRRSPTILEFFGVLYVFVILMWPAHQGFRFLVPLLPMVFLYLLLGTQALARRVPSAAIGRATMAAAVGIPFVFYTSNNAFQVPPSDRLEVTDEPSLALFTFLRETPEDAVFVFSKPRLLSLMTGHRAVANHEPERDRDLIEYLAEVGVTHMILGPMALGRRKYLDGFLRRNSFLYRSIYVNERFEVFEVVE
jgi:4-amino-4-deoxy-L-arabinose transferase-like glycosyltransferase